MEIKNDKAASVGEYAWEPGSVVEVPDELAAELIAIKDSGFYDAASGPAAFDPDQQRREALSAATIGPVEQGRGATKASEFPSDEPVVTTEPAPDQSVPEVDPAEVVTEPAPETVPAPEADAPAAKATAKK